MRANIPGRSPSRYARDLVTAGVTRCHCQRPQAPPSWTMPVHFSSEVGRGPGGAGEAAGNAPVPTGEAPPAIRETSASTSLRPPLATSCSCSYSVAKSSPVAAPAPTEGSDAGGVGDAPTTAGGPTLLPLTCVPPVTSAAGTAAGISPPREDVAAAADVAAAPDEDMGKMPPPTWSCRRRRYPVPMKTWEEHPPRAKISKMPPPPPLRMKTWEECPPYVELLTPPESRREYHRRVKMLPLTTDPVPLRVKTP